MDGLAGASGLRKLHPLGAMEGGLGLWHMILFLVSRLMTFVGRHG